MRQSLGDTTAKLYILPGRHWLNLRETQPSIPFSGSSLESLPHLLHSFGCLLTIIKVFVSPPCACIPSSVHGCRFLPVHFHPEAWFADLEGRCPLKTFPLQVCRLPVFLFRVSGIGYLTPPLQSRDLSLHRAVWWRRFPPGLDTAPYP